MRWSPSVLHPQLKDGQRFAVNTDPNPRQPIVDRNGNPLQEPTSSSTSGVLPRSSATRRSRSSSSSRRITGFAEDRLLSRIRSSPPKQSVQLANFGRPATAI